MMLETGCRIRSFKISEIPSYSAGINSPYIGKLYDKILSIIPANPESYIAQGSVLLVDQSPIEGGVGDNFNICHQARSEHWERLNFLISLASSVSLSPVLTFRPRASPYVCYKECLQHLQNLLKIRILLDDAEQPFSKTLLIADLVIATYPTSCIDEAIRAQKRVIVLFTSLSEYTNAIKRYSHDSISNIRPLKNSFNSSDR
jgi:hypothetical protein